MKTRAKSRIKKKDTKKPLGKKQRGSSVGSLATNPHEGSRSEYLAQYVFSSFGTAIPVPHQEDTGLDMYCTLLERVGRRSWPRAYYSVQVKSTMEPWIFGSPESVRWIVEHPLPIFLCIVLKSEARILVYHTAPRFAAWILPLHKERLELVPGLETKPRTIETSWEIGSSFELKAPILNFTIQEALDDAFRARLAAVLKFWIDIDMENIFRIKCGNHNFQAPYEYETNCAEGKGGTSEFGGPFSEESVQPMKAVIKELLAHLTTHLYLAAPTMMVQAACIPGNATVPPGANTTDPSGPFYIDTAGLNMKTSPPTRDPANPAYPPAKELPDETLPATDSEGN